MKVFVIGKISLSAGDSNAVQSRELLSQSMRALGRNLILNGNDLIVCSPFPDSADYDVVLGAAEVVHERKQASVCFHHPSSPDVAKALADFIKVIAPLRVTEIVLPPPADETSGEAWKNAWLLAQLSAMESSHLVVAIGGELTGPMSFLLPLAETKAKPILPFTFLGGAAEQCYARQRFSIADKLGEDARLLGSPEVANSASRIIDRFMQGQSPNLRPGISKCFLSYAKARPQEADFVETLLRRRNLTVFRDEKDFGAGATVMAEITRNIRQSDVFIAIWCAEYACSPWCFDEFEIALTCMDAGTLKIWLVCVDETRIVPPRARDIIYYKALSRDELEGRILKLLG